VTVAASYRGRFAPSPTGPLHFGSLVAALASFLDARRHGGIWLVRLEDLDTDRNQPGAEDAILRCLEGFGLHWDEPLVRQSERQELYDAALQQLRQAGLAYPCGCSRKSLAQAEEGMGGPRYPGTCRNGLPAGAIVRSFRFKSSEMEITFKDRYQGEFRQNVGLEVGDFVIKRADGPFAYQLAVVVDDAAQGITDVVRGADLLDSTPRQILLQQALNLPTPRYLHVPVATNAQGEKLSKQTRAPAVQPNPQTLKEALQYLGYTLPQDLGNDLNQIMNYALQAAE
jgi:glutamyl-Q tRNA(Asp) synthetase